jgi:alkylation response protein AidB-like acyl-CoA dehydrogenase
VNLDLTDQQQLLKDTFAKLFQDQSTPARVRAAAPLGFDRTLWSALVELGTPLMRVPEEAGGLGLSLHDAAIIAEEAGRHLASVPLVEIIVTARLLGVAGAKAAPWIDRIASGDAIIVTALEPAIDKVGQIVPGAAVADAVLTLDGEALVLIAAKPANVAPANIGQLPVAKLVLAGEGVVGTRTVLIEGPEARTIWAASVEEWRLLSAAMLAGLSRRALELAADYANERIQFGRPIGSFQGLAHPLADAVTDVEAAQLLIWKAIWAIAVKDEEAGALAMLASWWVGQASVIALRRAIRALGGYGLSLEYDLQLYHRRGSALVSLGGDPEKLLVAAGERLYSGVRAVLPDAGPTTVSFALGHEAEAFGERMSAFFAANQTPELQAKAHHSTSSHHKPFHAEMARAGLIYRDWPVEHGGEGATPQEDFAGGGAFELWNYTTHVISTTNLVAQMVMLFGTDEAKAEILPRVKSGEAVCSLGFSEPSAGSDVFAARTRAIRDPENGDWTIDGQKMFTTAAHYADYIIVLARSDPNESKHRGLTLFVVPTSLPGFSFQPVLTYQDERTNITFFSELKLPDRYRLGGVDEGSRVMASALSKEHGGSTYFQGQQRMMKYAHEWLRTAVGGTRPIDDPAIRRRMAMVKARYEAAHCFVVRGLWASDTGRYHRAWGSMEKMFVSDAYMRSCWEILEMAGAEGILTGQDHPLGIVELGHRRAYGMTIYGGTNEIHRSIIAEQALGLPKSRS